MTAIEQLQSDVKKIMDHLGMNMPVRGAIKETSPEPEKLPYNAWYKLKKHPLAIAFFTSESSAYGTGSYSNWRDDTGWVALNSGVWEYATHMEVQTMLGKEAITRGFKKGVKVTRSWSMSRTPVTLNDIGVSLSTHQRILFMDGYEIMSNGVWGQIIQEDEKILIGGYEVNFDKVATDNLTTIDGHYFSVDFWKAANTVSVNTKAKIMVGCSKQFDVSHQIIIEILNRCKQLQKS